MNITVDGAVRLGAGIVTEDAVLITHPWMTLGLGRAQLSLQAPLTTEFEAGQLRSREWDEVSDYGRILRLARYGDSVRIGQIEHRSLGFETVMRRYYNGVDPDHYRVGLELEYAQATRSFWAPDEVSFVVDHLLRANRWWSIVGLY